jgi:hypothetical protein
VLYLIDLAEIPTFQETAAVRHFPCKVDDSGKTRATWTSQEQLLRGRTLLGERRPSLSG